MQEFNIEIKNEKIKAYKLITLLVVVLNVLFFSYSILYSNQRKSALISLGFIVMYIAYRYIKSGKQQQPFFLDEWIYFLLMILWVDNYLIAILFMFLFLLYAVSLQKIVYSFDNSLIKQKNFPWKKHHWDELSNVMLKDNLLTIDFKNNKLMQAEIMNRDINESAFNLFAQKQLLEG